MQKDFVAYHCSFLNGYDTLSPNSTDSTPSLDLFALILELSTFHAKVNWSPLKYTFMWLSFSIRIHVLLPQAV